jgi:hypothetical protein
MAYKKGGLAHFATGGSTTEPDTSTDSKDTVVPVKETMTIGGAKVPLRTAISGEVLKNLEDEVARRTTGFGGFMNPIMGGFERAIAMTSKNPGSAIAEVGAKQRAEQQDLINMRTNIASIRAAQERARADSTKWGAMNGQGGGAGAGGTAGGAYIDPSQLAAEDLLEYPEDKLASRQAYLQKQANETAKSRVSPESRTQKQYFIDGRSQWLTPNEIDVNGRPIAQSGQQTTSPTGSTAPASNTQTLAAPGSPFDVSKSYGTPDKLLDNLRVAESSNNPFALHPTTKAMGAYQFMPETAAMLHKAGIKFNPFDEKESRAAADYYINQLVQKNGGDYAKAMAQYGGFVTKDPSQYVGKVLNGVNLNVAPATTAGAQTSPNAPVAAAVSSSTNPQPTTQQPPRFASKEQEEAYNAANKVKQEEFARTEQKKQTEYQDDFKKAEATYNEFNKLLEASKGHKDIFNLSGQGIKGPALAWFLKDKDAINKGETENDAIAKTILNNEKQGHFRNVKAGAAVAQSEWAKQLIQGAGGRLTNADLALGAIAKGVGPDTTYESHMENLAKNMESARTAFYRAKAWDEFSKAHPGVTTNDFEKTDEYLYGARDKARLDVGQTFKDIGEAKYVKVDPTTKKRFVVKHDGKGAFVE